MDGLELPQDSAPAHLNGFRRGDQCLDTAHPVPSRPLNLLRTLERQLAHGAGSPVRLLLNHYRSMSVIALGTLGIMSGLRAKLGTLPLGERIALVGVTIAILGILIAVAAWQWPNSSGSSAPPTSPPRNEQPSSSPSSPSTPKGTTTTAAPTTAHVRRAGEVQLVDGGAAISLLSDPSDESWGLHTNSFKRGAVWYRTIPGEGPALKIYGSMVSKTRLSAPSRGACVNSTTYGGTDQIYADDMVINQYDCALLKSGHYAAISKRAEKGETISLSIVVWD